MIWRDLIKITPITREKHGAVGGVCQGNCGQSRAGLSEKLNASRAHGNKKGGALWLLSWFSLRLWLMGSWALLPRGYVDDPAAAACISQWMVFCLGRNSGRSLELGWPGRGWQVYSVGVLEGSGFEAEACHSSIV